MEAREKTLKNSLKDKQRIVLCQWLFKNEVNCFGFDFSMGLINQCERINKALAKETDLKIKKQVLEYLKNLNEVAEINAIQSKSVINKLEQLIKG